MNLKSLVYFSLFGLTALNGNAQNATDELIKINDKSFTVGEFERIYTKNLNLIKDKEQKQIDNYLDLFILYKLKLNKAYELGLDQKSSYLREFDMHRNELAEQYFTNDAILEKMAHEAYDRSLQEVRASHIIFLVSEWAPANDTLIAYNKAIEVRNEILKGKPFAEAAKEYSADPTAKQSGGDLGYFSAMRMVYPFETGAYNAEIGTVSMPVRSQFGYHLILVADKRARPGKREVAHIVIENTEQNKDADNKVRIDKIYEQLENGASFEELALKYSDDEYSRNYGGVFGNYEPGALGIENLDAVVYDLKKVGTYSKPFKSQYAWHIVKLVSEAPVVAYEDAKPELIRRVQSEGRAKIFKDELTTELKKRYNFKQNNANVAQTINLLDKAIKNKDTTFKKSKKPEGTLFTFANQTVTAPDFVKQLNMEPFNTFKPEIVENYLKAQYDDFVSTSLKSYFDENLENEFPDFKATSQEFKEGLLLFDLLSNEVWEKSRVDTLGYTKYYEANKNLFVKKPSITATIFKFESKVDAQKALKIFKGNDQAKKNTFIDGLKKNSMVVVTSGKFEEGQKHLPKDYHLQKGLSPIIADNKAYYIVDASEFTPTRLLDFDEARNQLLYEYQQVFEKEWIDSLKKNLKTEVNTEIFGKLKAKYNQK